MQTEYAEKELPGLPIRTGNVPACRRKHGSQRGVVVGRRPGRRAHRVRHLGGPRRGSAGTAAARPDHPRGLPVEQCRHGCGLVPGRSPTIDPSRGRGVRRAGSDDPPMFGTNLLEEYRRSRDILGLGGTQLPALATNCIERSAATTEIRRENCWADLQRRRQSQHHTRARGWPRPFGIPELGVVGYVLDSRVSYVSLPAAPTSQRQLSSTTGAKIRCDVPEVVEGGLGFPQRPSARAAAAYSGSATQQVAVSQATPASSNCARGTGEGTSTSGGR
jgi:hypothetical protein